MKNKYNSYPNRMWAYSVFSLKKGKYKTIFTEIGSLSHLIYQSKKYKTWRVIIVNKVITEEVIYFV